MDPDNLLQGNIKDVRSLKPTSFQQTIPERDALKAFFFSIIQFKELKKGVNNFLGQSSFILDLPLPLKTLEKKCALPNSSDCQMSLKQ